MELAIRELVPQISERPVDVVFLAFGVNDVLELTTTRRWTHGLIQLISQVRSRIGFVPIIISAVPPMGHFLAFPQPLR